MIKVIERPHKYLILNMFKKVWATCLVRYIVLNLMQENLLINYRYCYIYTDSRIVVLADFDLANIGFPDSL